MASNTEIFYNDSTMDNDSFDFMPFHGNESDSMEKSKRNLVGYLEVVFAILLLVCNLFIVCVILVSKKLRCSSKHLLILNLSFVDMLKVFSLAINAYMKFSYSSSYICDLQYISRLITDLTTGLSGVFIFLLHIDYIASNNTTSIYPGRRLVGPVLLAFFSYIVTGAVLVPIYVLHLQPDQYDISPGNCWPFMTEGTFLLYEGLAVVPQNLLILVSGGMTIGAYISRSYLLNISKELNLVRRPVDINIAGFLTVILHGVAYLYHIVDKLICIGIQCSDMTGLDIIIPLLPFIKCVILPFVWLLCPDFRIALSACCTKRQKHVTIQLPAEIEKEECGSTSNEPISKSPKLKEKGYSDVIEELKNEKSKEPKSKSPKVKANDKSDTNSTSPKLKEKKDAAVIELIPNPASREEGSANIETDVEVPNEPTITNDSRLTEANISTVSESSPEEPKQSDPESPDIKRETYVIDQVAKGDLKDIQSSPKVQAEVVPATDVVDIISKDSQDENDQKSNDTDIATVSDDKPVVMISPQLGPEPGPEMEKPLSNNTIESKAHDNTESDTGPEYPEPYQYPPHNNSEDFSNPPEPTDDAKSNPTPPTENLSDYDLNSPNDNIDDFDQSSTNDWNESYPDDANDDWDDRDPENDSPAFDGVYPGPPDDDWNISNNNSESYPNAPTDNLNGGYPIPPIDYPHTYPDLPSGGLIESYPPPQSDYPESYPPPQNNKTQSPTDTSLDEDKEKVVMV